MARPQLENGHTQIANEILDHLMTLHLPPNQWQIVICIIRKTYGYHKKTDYIANAQIIEATNLGKTVVSRAINELVYREIITKNGKYLGFQKDWEKWKELAIQSTYISNTANSQENNMLAIMSTKVSNLDNNSTEEKLAVSQQKLAILQPELAIMSTKVSSPLDIQKIKDTYTKDTIQNICIRVFDFWNNQQIKIHRSLNGTKSTIELKLKTYSYDEIIQSITNYSEIIKNDGYYFKYRWTLKDFLNRGLEKFLDGDIARNNYKDKHKKAGIKDGQITPGNPFIESN
jgi:phage replication O-like protein O